VVHEIQVEFGAATLVGSYSPAGPTVVLALHGAGEGRRDWYLYRHLHEVLPPAGIGVVTFDRRGEGESTGEPSRGSFAVQADDALALAEAVEAEQVGLWGISQGGWVAPLAATRSERIAFLVLLASVGVTPAEQMRYATAEQIRRAGFGEDAAARAVALRERAEEWIRGGNTEPLEAELAAAVREPWWELTFLPESLPPQPEADIARKALAEEMFFEPEPIFAAVHVPTLLFYGDDDSWTPVDASIETWRRARGDWAEIVVLEDTGHEPIHPNGAIAREYERKLVEWVRAQ
jgi:pimeloyl-ACP methyl ester carboxylesterase